MPRQRSDGHAAEDPWRDPEQGAVTGEGVSELRDDDRIGLSRAGDKLGVGDRTQAVLKTINPGLLS